MSPILKQSQLIGAVLTVTGSVVFGVSIIFLQFSSIQLISTDALANSFVNEMLGGFEWYTGDFGFVLYEQLKVPPLKGNEGIHEQLIGSSNNANEEIQHRQEYFEMYLQKMNSIQIFSAGKRVLQCSIPKFKDTAIFAMAAALLQITASLFYIFWKEKNIKIMSIIFYIYFFIFLTHLTCFCIVLNTKPNRSYQMTKKFNYSREKSDIFSIILAINCLTIISCTIMTCVRCSTEDYTDRCIDSETCNRVRSTPSGGNTLNSANASTDRLNK